MYKLVLPINAIPQIAMSDLSFDGNDQLTRVCVGSERNGQRMVAVRGSAPILDSQDVTYTRAMTLPKYAGGMACNVGNGYSLFTNDRSMIAAMLQAKHKVFTFPDFEYAMRWALTLGDEHKLCTGQVVSQVAPRSPYRAQVWDAARLQDNSAEYYPTMTPNLLSGPRFVAIQRKIDEKWVVGWARPEDLYSEWMAVSNEGLPDSFSTNAEMLEATLVNGNYDVFVHERFEDALGWALAK